MSNKFYLRDGRNFIVNPETEDKPGDARAAKKVFLLTVNPEDLKTDKAWTVEAIRALSTGLVEVTTGKKRATKAELIERLEAYIKDERAALVVASQDILENLELCGYNPQDLLEMLGRMHGTALVNEIEKSILVKGYATSTIVKTLMPDIVKSINDHYKGDDKGYIVSELRRKFKSLMDEQNKDYKAKVAAQSHDRRPIKLRPLTEFALQVLQNIDTASWKELSIALALVTGRRMAEIHGVKTVFSEVPLSTHLVMFEGQLKTKGRGDLPPYEIQVLVQPQLVLKAWNKLRASGKAEYQPEEVNRKLSKALSTELPSSINKLFKDTGVACYKDLRDIYAAKLLENRPPNMTDNAYLARYLGHGENDVDTANTYQKIYLV